MEGEDPVERTGGVVYAQGMPEPRISVVITSMEGRAPWLREALQSVQNQTRPPDEVVLVLEGKDERWEDVLGRFSGVFPIRVLHRPRISGRPGPAKNLGLQAAKGCTYVVLLDDDDLALEDRIRLQVAFLERHPEYGWVASPMAYFGAMEGVWPDPGQAGEITLAAMMEGNRVLYSSVTIRGEVLEAFPGFPEDLPVGEDYAGWMALLARGVRGYLLPHVLGKRRVHARNVSRPGSLHLEAHSIVVASRFRDILPEGRKILARRWRRLARAWAREGRWDYAREGYLRAFEESRALKDWARAVAMGMRAWWMSAR